MRKFTEDGEKGNDDFLESIRERSHDDPEQAARSLFTVLNWKCSPSGTELRDAVQDIVSEFESHRRAAQFNACKKAASLFQQGKDDKAVEALDHALAQDERTVQQILGVLNDELDRVRQASPAADTLEEDPQPVGPRP